MKTGIKIGVIGFVIFFVWSILSNAIYSKYGISLYEQTPDNELPVYLVMQKIRDPQNAEWEEVERDYSKDGKTFFLSRTIIINNYTDEQIYKYYYDILNKNKNFKDVKIFETRSEKWISFKYFLLNKNMEYGITGIIRIIEENPRKILITVEH